jgi:hypothetical protein
VAGLIAKRLMKQVFVQHFAEEIKSWAPGGDTFTWFRPACLFLTFRIISGEKGLSGCFPMERVGSLKITDTDKK